MLLVLSSKQAYLLKDREQVVARHVVAILPYPVGYGHRTRYTHHPDSLPCFSLELVELDLVLDCELLKKVFVLLGVRSTRLSTLMLEMFVVKYLIETEGPERLLHMKFAITM